jgi:uncharacterized membrane protein
MQHGNQCPHRIRRPIPLNYLDAGLVAGTAAFSSLAGVLFAGFASFLTSTLAGALAAGAGVAGALAGSAAKADTANDAIKATINLFMLFPLRLILN